MAAVNLPRTTLTYGWERSEDQWGGPMNNNLMKLDALLGMWIISMSYASAPLTVSDGDIYVVASNATGVWDGQDGLIAYYENGAWSFFSPFKGLRAWVESYSDYMRYNGTTWVTESDGTDPTDPGSSTAVATAFIVNATISDDLYASESIIHMPVLYAMTLPANMAGSVLDMIAASVGYAQMQVQRNGQSVGTITVASGGYSATFATTGGNAVSFAKGDVLDVIAPTAVVTGFNGFGFALLFNITQV